MCSAVAVAARPRPRELAAALDGFGCLASNRGMAADERPFEVLLAPHLEDLRRYVARNATGDVRARENCSDLVQSVCRELLQHRARYRGDGFRAWLFATAKRKLVDRRRSHGAAKRAVAREWQLQADLDEQFAAASPSPERSAVARERLTRVEQAIAELPPDYREVLLLARVQGQSTEQIAAAMGRTEGAVRVLLCRAQARLVMLAGEA